MAIKKTLKKKTNKKKVVKKKVEKKKSNAGRPTKLTEDKKMIIEYLYRDGKTDKQVANALQVDKQTLYNWRKRDPRFFDSLKDWKDFSNRNVEISLLQRALGYSIKETKVFCNTLTGDIYEKEITKHYPPDPTSMIYWLKNRKPEEWRDRIDIKPVLDEVVKTFAFKLDVKPDEL